MTSPDINADELGTQNVVNVLNGIEHTFTAVNTLISVSELQCLVDSSGGPTGDSRSKQIIGDQINLDRRISPAVNDLSGLH